MFDREARWIGERLAAYATADLSPLLNIGSSTREFRERVQPWMVRHIFAPLAERGVEVVHLDARTGPGIDIRADLLDDADFARVSARRYRALLICNVLEHVRDAAEFARRCGEFVLPGGVIVVTVPRSYPRHGDPIDTLYRPTPDEAAALFPHSALVAAEIIDVGESYRDEVRRRPWIMLRHALRLPVPFVGLEKWRQSMRKPYWLFHNYTVSAAILRRAT
jgi:SAM-dependent methyltransferase